jgi:hypothetical protein
VSLAVIALAGCGGNDSSTPESQAQATVEQFVGALSSQDATTACGLLTAQLQAQLGGAQCEQALGALAGQATAPDVRVTDVRIAGNKAAVDTEKTADTGPASTQTWDLLEESGQWRISNFSGQ